MAQRPPIFHGRFRRRFAGESAPLTLLILFLLAGILTATLLPAYRDYTIREHSKLAKNVLMEASLHYGEWQALHPAVRLLTLESLGYETPAVYVSSDGNVGGSANINSIYRISLSYPTEPSAQSCGLVADDAQTGFILVAEPIQTQRIDIQCARLCLSSSGQKGVSGSASVEKCWGPAPKVHRRP
ncbi:hypothetical protein [Nevskia soli]|uniref:hypothetical protein n=1 Tax=Nevskia soli TaxID=418856 RepID=UPI0004A77895|nr:hypothetical protein [Nevskia soli]